MEPRVIRTIARGMLAFALTALLALALLRAAVALAQHDPAADLSRCSATAFELRQMKVDHEQATLQRLAMMNLELDALRARVKQFEAEAA